MNRRALIVGAAAAVAMGSVASCTQVDRQHTGSISAPAAPPPVLSASRPPAALKNIASKAGRYFGTAVQLNALTSDTALRSALSRECSSITPEWAMKWDSLASGPGSYNFSAMDRLVDFAGRNGLAVRGHTLLWHKSLPPWAGNLLAQTRQWQHVEDHFARVQTRYGSRIREWDVVNEPIEPQHGGQGLRHNQFFDAFGGDYIEWAFWSAHKFAPGALKLINEYGLEYASSYEGQRRLSLLRLLERLRSKGAPIGGVGLQAHLDLRKGALDRNGIYGLLRDISGLGLKIVVTELDVTEANTSLSLNRRDSLVADETRRYLDIVLQFPAVIGVNTWGLSDHYSWLRTERSSANRGLPYDAEWRVKPMHDAIRTALA